MSKYDWERGSLKFSTAEFPRFFKAFRDLVTAARASDYQTAMRLYEAVCAKGKGVRGVKWDVVFDEVMRTTTTKSSGWFGAAESNVYQFKVIPLERVKRNMVMRQVPNPKAASNPYAPKTLWEAGSPLKPKKGDYAATASKELAFSVLDEDGYESASITFDTKARKVSWLVSENNHAVERARSCWLATEFFNLLKSVKWSRGTGGVIVGNDEYNRDSDSAGDGGNYITSSYGPIGEQEREALYAPLTRSIRRAPRKSAAR